MNKKLASSAAALAAAVAVLIVLQRRHHIEPVPPAATPAPVSAPAPIPAPVVTPAPATPSAYEPEKEGDVIDALKGKDFTAEAIVSSDLHRVLEVSMADGTPLKFIRILEGNDVPLEENIVTAGYTYSLKQLLPDEPREQIICNGGELLARGEGDLNTYTAYRIEGDHLQEVIRVITKREVEEGNGPTPQQLTATLELVTRDGQPAFIYRVKADTKPEQTIVFRWNGKIFEDTSGAYRKIAEEYNP